MPRAQPLHKDTGAYVLDNFRGVNTQVHPSKLTPGQLSVALNNTSKYGNARKEHGWAVVNDDDLTAGGSRLTNDQLTSTWSGTPNVKPISGIYPYRYFNDASLVTSYIAVCGPEVYAGVASAADPTSDGIHEFGGTGTSGDLPCFAEWDGYLFFSIGRETTSVAWGDDAIQVYDPLDRSGEGVAVMDFKQWIDAVLGTTFGATQDFRPRWMAVNWGYLVIAGTYNKSTNDYHNSTLYYVDLNSPVSTWNVDILGEGTDYGDTYINGMIDYGDHILVFTRHRDIVRFQNLTGLNIESVAIGGTLGTDNSRRIAYQSGCAAGHSLVKVGKRLLWLADDGVWMLDDSESLIPVRISEALDGLDGIWANVNLSYIEGACATYDESLRQILFSVPYNSSAINNKWIVAQLPDNDYEAADFRTWDWSLRSRTAASIAYDKTARTVIWGSSLDSGLVCKESLTATAGGPTTGTNVGTVTYTGTTITETAGATWTADELIGLPVTIANEEAWITDNTTTAITHTGFGVTPATDDSYFLGGILWWAIFDERQMEDTVFWGTGYFRLSADGATTVYTEQYKNGSSTPSIDSYVIDPGGLTIPFDVGPSALLVGTTEQEYTLYSDTRAASMKLGLREPGYTASPRFIRLDWPIHRITRTRRRG